MSESTATPDAYASPDALPEDWGTAELPVDIEAHGDQMRELVPEMQEGPGPMDPLYGPPAGEHTPVQPAAAPAAVDAYHATEEARGRLLDHLQDLAELASDLAQKNMEHRVGDLRDVIPVLGNIRSHELATKEGDIIADLKFVYQQLQQEAAASGMPLDLSEIGAIVDKLRVPGGFTKIAASLLPGTRTFHRALFAPRAEDLRSAVNKLRRQLRT